MWLKTGQKWPREIVKRIFSSANVVYGRPQLVPKCYTSRRVGRDIKNPSSTARTNRNTTRKLLLCQISRRNPSNKRTPRQHVHCTTTLHVFVPPNITRCGLHSIIKCNIITIVVSVHEEHPAEVTRQPTHTPRSTQHKNQRKNPAAYLKPYFTGLLPKMLPKIIPYSREVAGSTNR